MVETRRARAAASRQQEKGDDSSSASPPKKSKGRKGSSKAAGDPRPPAASKPTTSTDSETESGEAIDNAFINIGPVFGTVVYVTSVEAAVIGLSLGMVASAAVYNPLGIFNDLYHIRNPESVVVAGMTALGTFVSSILALSGVVLAVQRISRQSRRVVLAEALVAVVVFVAPFATFAPGIADAWVRPPPETPDGASVGPSAWQLSSPTKGKMHSAAALAQLPYFDPFWKEARRIADPVMCNPTYICLKSYAGTREYDEEPRFKTSFWYRPNVHRALKALFVDDGVLDVERNASKPVGPPAMDMTLMRGNQSGMFVLDAKRAVVFFSGASTEEDVRNDVNIELAPPASLRCSSKATPMPMPSDALVHAGFQEHVNGTLKETLRHLAKLPRSVDELYLVGHSLGGASALLVAAAVACSGGGKRFPKTTVVAIASPRVGNAPFMEFLAAQRHLRIWRAVNHLDPVPRTPWWLPAPARFRHPYSTEVWLWKGRALVTPPGRATTFGSSAWNAFTVPVRYALYGSDAAFDLSRHLSGAYTEELAAAEWVCPRGGCRKPRPPTPCEAGVPDWHIGGDGRCYLNI